MREKPVLAFFARLTDADVYHGQLQFTRIHTRARILCLCDIFMVRVPTEKPVLWFSKNRHSYFLKLTTVWWRGGRNALERSDRRPAREKQSIARVQELAAVCNQLLQLHNISPTRRQG